MMSDLSLWEAKNIEKERVWNLFMQKKKNISRVVFLC